MSHVILRIMPETPMTNSAFTNFIKSLSIGVQPAFSTSGGVNRPAIPMSEVADGLGKVDPSLNQIPNLMYAYRMEYLITGKANPLANVITVNLDISDIPAGNTSNVELRVVMARDVNGSVVTVFDQDFSNVRTFPGVVRNPKTPAFEHTSLHLFIPDSTNIAPPASTSQREIIPYERVKDLVSGLNLPSDIDYDNFSYQDAEQLVAIHFGNAATTLPKSYIHNIHATGLLNLPYHVNSFELANYYTLGINSSSPEQRHEYEKDLQFYYLSQRGLDRFLAEDIYSCITAVAATNRTKTATKLVMNMPSLLDRKNNINVLINTVDNGKSHIDLTIDDKYFYALQAYMPQQVTAQRRYRLLTLRSRAEIVAGLEKAIADGVIEAPTGDGSIIYEIARRISAMNLSVSGITQECGLNSLEYVVDSTGDKVKIEPKPVVHKWLRFRNSDDSEYWTDISDKDDTRLKGHLFLTLCAIGQSHEEFGELIFGQGIISTAELNEWNEKEWTELMKANPSAIPAFIDAPSIEEKIVLLILELDKYFDIERVPDDIVVPDPEEEVIPQLPEPGGNAIQDIIDQYIEEKSEPGNPYVIDFNDFDFEDFEEFTNGLDASDADKNIVLERIRDVSDLVGVTNVGVGNALQLSIIEALWSRGIQNKGDISKYSAEHFELAINGTVAAPYAAQLFSNAGGGDVTIPPLTGEFTAINEGSNLINVIPSKVFNPQGSVAYLNQLLNFEITAGNTVGEALNGFQQPESYRSRDYFDLDLTDANLSTPIPVIDIVNEQLEQLVAGESNNKFDGPLNLYNTSSDAVANHLIDNGQQQGKILHDAASLLEALPEYSTPALPNINHKAYYELATDFSHLDLPYSRQADVSRTYLEFLGTTRFDTLRTLRKDIREMTLYTDYEQPEEFKSSLWRYPVDLDLALEYLRISEEQYKALYQNSTAADDTVIPGGMSLELVREIFGFSDTKVGPDQKDWKEVIMQVPQFLLRSGMSYCEFRAMVKLEELDIRVVQNVQGVSEQVDLPIELPSCEPDLTNMQIDVLKGTDTIWLRKIARILRLRQTLNSLDGVQYSWRELQDIANAFGFQDDNGIVNEDFIRQLVALQMFQDEYALDFSIDSEDNPISLLDLWSDNASDKTLIIDILLDQVQRRAIDQTGCICRDPLFLRLLKENLDSLSKLAGFDPDYVDQTSGERTRSWHYKPTHTLRFAEVLAKIYASDFSIGELQFLFSDEDNLQGDDPFMLQSRNDTLSHPFALPENTEEYTLEQLRKKLLAVDVSDEEAEAVTWENVKTFMAELDRDPQNWLNKDSAPLKEVLKQFACALFPDVIGRRRRRHDSTPYEVELPSSATSADLWNTPDSDLFQYADSKLSTRVALRDEDLIHKLSQIRQLNDQEIAAVQSLYFQPRIQLLLLSPIFIDQNLAEQHLIQQPDEAKRWQYFQQQFARFSKEVDIIQSHLSAHVLDTLYPRSEHSTDDNAHRAKEITKIVLNHLWPDENWADKSLSPNGFEDGSGKRPDLKWDNFLIANAYSALLGLRGTGLLAQYFTDNSRLRWQRLMGKLNDTDIANYVCNIPVPTVLPQLDLSVSKKLLQRFTVFNGIKVENIDGSKITGGEAYRFVLKGQLLIENGGKYTFWAGAPTPDGEEPNFEAIDHSHSWRVTISRGQRRWVLVEHNMKNSSAPASCSKPLSLTKGFYDIEIEVDPGNLNTKSSATDAWNSGFEIKYKGEDTDNSIIALPYSQLFVPTKDSLLGDGVEVEGKALEYLNSMYYSTIRDIRRTYQRAFKAVLYAYRSTLNHDIESDKNFSELNYLLNNGHRFAGDAYYLENDKVVIHRANFDFNLLPIADNYHTPDASQDSRVASSLVRRQALFDSWERMYDYVQLREATAENSKAAWLLFHEAEENHPGFLNHLNYYLGIELNHVPLVTKYTDNEESRFALTDANLRNEEWAIRAHKADQWLHQIDNHFDECAMAEIEPDKWAILDKWVAVIIDGETVFLNPLVTGNENLTTNVRNSYIEQENNKNYAVIQNLNDGLRSRARETMLHYITALDRYVDSNAELSELLLIDVETSIEQKITRVQAAINAVHWFMQRARLGLEEIELVGDSYNRWKQFFQNFDNWKTGNSRNLYKENWVEWDELEQARKSESFELLEFELKKNSIAIAGITAESGSNGKPIPPHTNVPLLQSRTNHKLTVSNQISNTHNVFAHPDDGGQLSKIASEYVDKAKLPQWLTAAIGLGLEYYRIAAAGYPMAGDQGVEVVDQLANNLVDEYYFWLTPSSEYAAPTQTAAPQWHDPSSIPSLLQWQDGATVHLNWCRMHNGEFQNVRKSDQGIAISGRATPQFKFLGREGDSLRFEVVNGTSKPGYPSSATTFRYDIARDSSSAEPTLGGTSIGIPSGQAGVSGLRVLNAYPFFALHRSGAPLVPTSDFALVITIAGYLRAHCRYDDALKWYDTFYNPLEQNNAALFAQDTNGSSNADIILQQRKTLVLHYVQTLYEWAQSLLQGNTEENIQRARLAILTANKILGSQPRKIRQKAEDMSSGTANLSFSQGLNPKLIELYDCIEDQKLRIQRRIGANGLRNSSDGNNVDRNMRTFGITPEQDQEHGERGELVDGCISYYSPYRYSVLLQNANQIAGEVRSMGGALLSAFEKGDAEYLADMRARHEKQILNRTLEIRKNQWREADWQVQQLQKAKLHAIVRRAYNQFLIAQGIIPLEESYVDNTEESMEYRLLGQAAELAASALGLVPDAYTGSVFAHLPTGSKLAEAIFGTLARILNYLGDRHNTLAGLDLTKAGWERREAEWIHQVNIISIEIEQIERQILAAERTRDNALHELNNHQQQMENSDEVHRFMRDKFTNHDLYLWLQQQTMGLYRQYYELAKHCAYQAEHAFNIERGHINRRFINSKAWENTREGLLAGERLQLSLSQMDKAWYDENKRDYELTKHLSLRHHFPAAFMQLQASGSCEIAIPEWMFDQDNPGHYMRRIKSVAVTIPCVVGPYTSVNCKLTLLGSTTRINSRLNYVTPPQDCDADTQPDPYLTEPDDNRIVTNYIATDAIATSTGQSDSGVFELNFGDGRYLPFEYGGAISRWRIELPQDNNYFDTDSMNDLIMHMSYMAREGGDILAAAASDSAKQKLPGAGIKLIDVRQDYADEWHLFSEYNCDIDARGKLYLELQRLAFPYLPRQENVAVHTVDFYFKLKPGVELEDNRVAYYPAIVKGQILDDDFEPIPLTASDSEIWPGYHHAIAEVDVYPLNKEGTIALGMFKFPNELKGKVEEIRMLLGYKKTEIVEGVSNKNPSINQAA